MITYIPIGSTKKTHGLDGAIKLQIDEVFLEDFLSAKVLFIAVQGKEVPFFIEKVDQVGGAILVNFEDVNSKEDGSALVGKPVLLRKSDLKAKSEKDTLFMPGLVGYTIEDTNVGVIGSIEEVLELPQQWMALLDVDGKEIMIPLNDALIEEVEEDHILMNLPEGLLDL